jgi:hypothetical protein
LNAWTFAAEDLLQPDAVPRTGNDRGGLGLLAKRESARCDVVTIIAVYRRSAYVFILDV